MQLNLHNLFEIVVASDFHSYQVKTFLNRNLPSHLERRSPILSRICVETVKYIGIRTHKLCVSGLTRYYFKQNFIKHFSFYYPLVIIPCSTTVLYVLQQENNVYVNQPMQASKVSPMGIVTQKYIVKQNFLRGIFIFVR